jgi:hypothetical protein
MTARTRSVTHIFLAIMIAALCFAGVWVSQLPDDFALMIGGLAFNRRTFLFGVIFCTCIDGSILGGDPEQCIQSSNIQYCFLSTNSD